MMTPHTPLLQKRHEKGKYQDLFTLILPEALQSAWVPASCRIRHTIVKINTLKRPAGSFFGFFSMFSLPSILPIETRHRNI
jgi:hypothetical protein